MCGPLRKSISLSKNFDDIHAHLESYDGVVALTAWGETTFFYNPNRLLNRGTYFATLKEKNGPNDKASALDRKGVFRLNMGVQKSDYFDLFGLTPPRPLKGQIVAGTWDFTTLNQLTPHPIYGWMGWISILNPDKEAFKQCLPLLDSAYEKAKSTFEKRTKT